MSYIQLQHIAHHKKIRLINKTRLKTHNLQNVIQNANRQDCYDLCTKQLFLKMYI